MKCYYFNKIHKIAPNYEVRDAEFNLETENPRCGKHWRYRCALCKKYQHFDALAWFNTPAYNNKFYAAWDMLGIDGSVFDRGTPDFNIPTNSPLANGAKWDHTPFVQSSTMSAWFGQFEQVPFAGAFGTTADWTQGWANFSTTNVYLD